MYIGFVLRCSPRAWAWALMVAAVLLTPCAALSGPREAPVMVLTLAERFTADGTAEGDRTLPDLGIAGEVRTPDTRLYRLKLNREVLTERLGGPTALLGVRLTHACNDLTLKLNGATLHETRYGTTTRFNGCYGPHLASLSWQLLQAGENTLEVEVAGWPLAWVSTSRRAMAVSDVTIGAYEPLRERHQHETMLTKDVPAMAAAATFLLGLMCLSLAVVAAREPHLMYFSALCMLWAALCGHSLWSEPVGSPLMREGVQVLMMSAAALCLQRFACRYADLQAPVLNRVAMWQLILAPVAVAGAGSQYLFAVSAAWSVVAAGLVAGSAATFVKHMSEPRRRPMKRMAYVFAVAVILAMLELLVSLGVVEPLPYFPLLWGIPVCLMLMGAMQVVQFGMQSHQFDAAQRQLEQRMEQVRSEVELSFSQLAEARIAQVTSVERKRIAADLHDDLGAKLLTIVHTSRSDRIAALGREALDEMRLSVRGLTGRPMELAEALADWRTEAMARLSATGIELDWPLPLEELPQVLGSRTMVQTTRILREVFNNLIRHSQASRCEVSTSVKPHQLVMEIGDDGIGFDPEKLRGTQAGLGLLNMAHRAKQLKGECVIESRVGAGSRVRLTLPLDGSAA